MSDALKKSVTELASRFSGRLLLPGDPGYDEARRVHNGLIDKRPAAIAQCRGAADIADAIQLGRTLGLDLAVRGGGHNVSGRATVDKGLMIDLSAMRGVHVDARGRVARVEGGSLWREFNRETQAHGLATTGGIVGTTGVAGLTLGGGLGWLMPRHGLSLDNLQSVDMVLADGAIVRANAHEHSDLFWAVRGGGGNFGVASTFEFRLHPIGPVVTGGLAAWPFAQAKDVLRLFRDRAAALTDDMMLVAALITEPQSGHKLAAIAAGHFGPMADAAAALAPIKSFATPAMDMLGPIPYVQLNALLDGAFPRGALNYWKSHFVEDLTDAAIDALVECAARCPTPMGQIVIEHFHGAATRVPVSDTAFALRSPGFNTLLLSEWTDPAQSGACVTWAKESYGAIRPFVGSRRYVNYFDSDDTLEQALVAAYGPNLPRLKQMKKKYDPDNVFHLNVNIPPA
jgi:FAD/FMN-containing dehydrogenase